MFDAQKSIEAQKKYCEENQDPHFAPYSGICWSCNRNIYQPVGWKYENGRKVQVSSDSSDKDRVTGVTVEKAGSELVTGCPHCNRSYCD